MRIGFTEKRRKERRKGGAPEEGGEVLGVGQSLVLSEPTCTAPHPIETGDWDEIFFRYTRIHNNTYMYVISS
jgi:hypothetical protein